MLGSSSMVNEMHTVSAHKLVSKREESYDKVWLVTGVNKDMMLWDYSPVIREGRTWILVRQIACTKAGREKKHGVLRN